MSKSDRVLGTPPTNTSVLSDNPPFASLAAAVAPQWGETILLLTQATDRLANRFDRFVGAEKRADTVKACRELADELICFLDGLEDTDQDAAVDDERCDGHGDDEPCLGSFDRMVNQEKGWICSHETAADTDAELDDCDNEDDDPAEEHEPSGIADLEGVMEQWPQNYQDQSQRVE